MQLTPTSSPVNRIGCIRSCKLHLGRCEICIDQAESAFVNTANNISRFMTSLLGCPVCLSYRRAAFQCAFEATPCGTATCGFSRRLSGDSLRPACDRSRSSRSHTFRQQHSMSHSLTTVQPTSSQPQSNGQDLLVIGPGVLGSYVGILWQQQHPSATVVGQTNSTANHDR